MILDTVALSALIDGDAALAKILDISPRHHLAVVVLGEYRYGMRRSRKRERLETALALLEENSDILVVDPETARSYAAIRHELRAAGLPIPMNDVWIAALARQHGLAVVSRDRHYDRVKDLKRLSW